MLHLVGCLYYLYQWCTVKQISDNEIYLLIQYIRSVLWRVVKRLSYKQDARCLMVNKHYEIPKYMRTNKQKQKHISFLTLNCHLLSDYCCYYFTTVLESVTSRIFWTSNWQFCSKCKVLTKQLSITDLFGERKKNKSDFH